MPPRWHHVVVAAGEWTNNDHVKRYLAHADTFPHRAEGESVLLDHVPLAARRILDLGTGDGRLLALLRVDRPGSVGVGVDVSEPMLERARERFAGEPVEVLGHDLAEPLRNRAASTPSSPASRSITSKTTGSGRCTRRSSPAWSPARGGQRSSSSSRARRIWSSSMPSRRACSTNWRATVAR